VCDPVDVLSVENNLSIWS